MPRSLISSISLLLDSLADEEDEEFTEDERNDLNNRAFGWWMDTVDDLMATVRVQRNDPTLTFMESIKFMEEEIANRAKREAAQEKKANEAPSEEGSKVEDIVNAEAANQCPDQPTALIVASGSSQQQTGRFEEEIASTQQPPATITSDHESVMEVDGAKEPSITVSFSLM